MYSSNIQVTATETGQVRDMADLHDGILVQLLSFLELFALACFGKQLFSLLQLTLLNLLTQPILLPPDPAG